MEQPQPDISTVYGCMLAGDECIRQLGNKCIFLVGESRVGKSTLFNYLLGMKLQAVESEETGEDIYECIQSTGA